MELITRPTAPRAHTCPAVARPHRPPAQRHELAAIGVGGAVGALARVAVSQGLPETAGQWPWATFAVNIAGAFALGCLLAFLRRGDPISVPLYRLLGTGFCSTFTTFSTFQLQLLKMIDGDRIGLAAGYAAASVALGYVAIWTATSLVSGIRAHKQ